jgi:zinc transport system permease protein
MAMPMRWAGTAAVGDMLALGFMQRALLAGCLVSLAASYYGVFVVQRRLAFLGHGLAHAAFGGVALGLLLGWVPLAVALPFTVLVALGIAWVSARTRLGQDTSIGILFSLALALGVVFLALRPGFAADAMTYLFGSILAVNSGDLWAAGGLVLIAALTLRLWGRWAYATFDRESALADRLPVVRDDYLLAVLIAVTVVVAVKIVGALLVSAFLVIPAASARLLAPRFATMTWLAALLGTGSAVGGLLLSYALNLPSGAAIVLLQCAVFGVCMAVGRKL